MVYGNLLNHFLCLCYNTTLVICITWLKMVLVDMILNIRCKLLMTQHENYWKWMSVSTTAERVNIAFFICESSLLQFKIVPVYTYQSSRHTYRLITYIKFVNVHFMHLYKKKLMTIFLKKTNGHLVQTELSQWHRCYSTDALSHAQNLRGLLYHEKFKFCGTYIVLLWLM